MFWEHIFLACFHCLQWYYNALYSFISYNNFIYYLALILSCCSFLYGISLYKSWKEAKFRMVFPPSQNCLSWFSYTVQKSMVACCLGFPALDPLPHVDWDLLFISVIITQLNFDSTPIIVFLRVESCSKRGSQWVSFEFDFATLFSLSHHRAFALTGFWNGQNPSQFQLLLSDWHVTLSRKYWLPILWSYIVRSIRHLHFSLYCHPYRCNYYSSLVAVVGLSLPPCILGLVRIPCHLVLL